MATFNVFRDGVQEDAVFDVDPLTDTSNPFGDFCVVKIDDRGGDKFDKYSRGTALEVAINDDGQTYDRFDGYVVEARETEQSGADALEVEAYTFDQFLRRNTVSTDQTGNTIAEALESIVKNDTPVSYVASNIEVSDPQELTRSYRGEPVEVVLRDLAFKSGNEAFGVNDSREFFFRPRETKHIDRGIDNTQWFNYDIPELGKDAINEVEVFFNNGNESVVIDAPTDKLELQDGLSLPEPGTQREELNRPLVTDIQDAEDIGRQYLQFRNATLSGTVTTFGLYDAEPGDTINITIESRGIDTEFRIAAVEYRWGRDETILTVVERRGDQDKILSRISESVKRQEMETADRDAPSNRITTTEANGIVDVTVDADGNTPDDTRFVNPGRNAVRDAWAGDGNPDISTIAIGSDGSGLSRSNTDLNNQVASASATESLPTSTSAEYSASINQTGVEEIGVQAFDVFDSGISAGDGSTNIRVVGDSFFSDENITDDVFVNVETTAEDGEFIEARIVKDGDSVVEQVKTASGTEELTIELSPGVITFDAIVMEGDSSNDIVWSYGIGSTLIARAVFDTPVDLAGTVTVTLDVSNDSDVQRGVLTNDGQTAVRDVIADNSPALPTDYAYGSDGSAVSTSDTALGSQLTQVSLSEVLVQDADTNTEWGDITSLQNGQPLAIRNNQLELLQSSYVTEAEDATARTATLITRSDFSDGEGVVFNDTNDDALFSITTEYDISNLNVYIRCEEITAGDYTLLEIYDDDNGTQYTGGINPPDSLGWVNTDMFGSFDGSFGFSLEPNRDLAGQGQSYGEVEVDAIAFVDDDFSYTFDNTVDANGYLNGPELFPSGAQTTLDLATSRRNISKGTFNSTWEDNDVSGAQAIEIAPDGSTFQTFNNTTSGSYSFADPTQEITTRFTFDRYGSRTTATPTSGFKGQAVDLWELFVNPDTPSPDDIGTTNARAIVPPNTSGITGNTVREAGLKSGSTLLTHHQLAEFVLETDQRLASSETNRFKGTE